PFALLWHRLPAHAPDSRRDGSREGNGKAQRNENLPDGDSGLGTTARPGSTADRSCARAIGTNRSVESPADRDALFQRDDSGRVGTGALDFRSRGPSGTAPGPGLATETARVIYFVAAEAI